MGKYDETQHRLWRYYDIDVGLSLVKVDGTWMAARLSSYPDLSVLQNYFQGGHVHTIDQATRDELVAAGFGAYIT